MIQKTIRHAALLIFGAVTSTIVLSTNAFAMTKEQYKAKQEAKNIIVTEYYKEYGEDNEVIITEEEADMLAQIVFAEAGNQDLYGQRLVVDVVLNRMLSDRFKCDTISDVIFARNQFSVVNNGSYYKAAKKVTAQNYLAVYLELYRISDKDVLFFCSTGYNGHPLYKHGDHYFSN